MIWCVWRVVARRKNKKMWNVTVLSLKLTSKIVHFNLFGGKIWWKISVLPMFTNIHLPAIIWLYKIALLVISSLPRFSGAYYMGWWLWGISLNEIPTTRALVETAAPMINFSLFPRGKLEMALHIHPWKIKHTNNTISLIHQMSLGEKSASKLSLLQFPLSQWVENP